jgi:hypothetical protein
MLRQITLAALAATLATPAAMRRTTPTSPPSASSPPVRLPARHQLGQPAGRRRISGANTPTRPSTSAAPDTSPMPLISGSSSRPTDDPLSFYVEARDDTVLLVNTPDGEWHCNDDFLGPQPGADLRQPRRKGNTTSGSAPIPPSDGDYPPATLAITQGGPSPPPSNAPSSARTTASPSTRPNRHGP